MKIGIIHGPFCLAGGDNGFDFARLWVDPRGLSGSDLGVFRIAQELARLGHQVDVFTFPKPGTPVIHDTLGPGVYMRHYDERIGFEGEAVVSWNEAEPLRCYRDRPNLKRVVSLQINSLVGGPDYDAYVDLWLSPSEPHRQMMLGKTHMVGAWRQEVPYQCKPDAWKVVPDGCDPLTYDKLAAHGLEKVTGRVIWTSSPDRGLHWLLSIWPQIRKAVPHATLAICYELRRWLSHMLTQDSAEFDPSILEQSRRAHYIDQALEKLRELGVYELGSLSRRDIARVQGEAECFPYTCDPPGIWTEGFSCSLMENCAARSGAIAADVDALGSIYQGSIPVLPRPSNSVMDRWVEGIGCMLTDAKHRHQSNEQGRALAEQFTWAKAAEKLALAISS